MNLSLMQALKEVRLYEFIARVILGDIIVCF